MTVRITVAPVFVMLDRHWYVALCAVNLVTSRSVFNVRRVDGTHARVRTRPVSRAVRGAQYALVLEEHLRRERPDFDNREDELGFFDDLRDLYA